MPTADPPNQSSLEHCSFCGATSDRAKALVAGPQHVYICDACVDLCRKTIDEASAKSQFSDAYAAENPEAAARWFSEVTVHLLEMQSRFAQSPTPVDTTGHPQHTVDQVGAVQKAMRNIGIELERTMAVVALCRASGRRVVRREPALRHSSRRRGPTIAPITDVFVGTRDFAMGIPISPITVGAPSVEARGILPVFVGRVSEILEPGTEASASNQYSIDISTGGPVPPWVVQLPDSISQRLSKLSDDRVAEVTTQLSKDERISAIGWTTDDIDWAVRQLRALSTRAQIDGTSVWIWIDP